LRYICNCPDENGGVSVEYCEVHGQLVDCLAEFLALRGEIPMYQTEEDIDRYSSELVDRVSRGFDHIIQRLIDCKDEMEESLIVENSPTMTRRTGTVVGAQADDQGSFFRKIGDVWNIRFEGKTLALNDNRGLQYICLLLKYQGINLTASTMIALAAGEQLPDLSRFLQGLSEDRLAHLGLSRVDCEDPMPLIDMMARLHCQQRLSTIKETLASESFSSPDEKCELEEERKTINEYLAAASSLHGRLRHSSSADRDRISVKNRITDALAKIAQHNTSLFRHLSNSIQTGTNCVYSPETPIPWEL
jgi:hypothetical protein